MLPGQRPAPMRWALAIAGWMLAASAFSQPPPDPAALERLEALSKQAQTCGMDLGCLARVQKEMQALTQELMKSAPVPPGATPGMPPPQMSQQMERGERAAQAAEKALESQRDEVCYAVLYQKRVAYEMHGSDLPWLSCTPLEIRVRWQISETDSLSGFNGRYEVTQTYPAYLEIERAQHERLRILAYRIVGPAPQGRVDPDGQLSSGSATLTGVKYYGILAPRPYDTRTFGTDNVADFSVAPDHGSLEFEYDLARPRGEQVIAHHLRIWGPRVSVTLRNPQAELAHTFFQPEVDEFGASAFARDEIAEGLRTGRLSKRFAVQIAQAQIKLNGSAEVTILFDHEPGRLRVTPATAVDASGPDCDLAFEPATTRYTLHNPGDAPIAYRIDGAAPWARLSRSAGTLQAGASTSVTVELDAASLIDKPGSHRATLAFRNTSNGRGDTQRTVTLSVKPTQEWQVRLDGHFSRRLWTEREMLIPGASSSKLIKDTRSYRFDYQLGAKAMIEKREGKWRYTCGRVTASNISYSYGHTPSNLWNVTKKICVGCSKIQNLTGKALDGVVHDGSLQLLWDDIRPGLEVTADLGVKCWENKALKQSCGYSQKGGTAYYGDDLFMHNASSHSLPLKTGSYTPKKLEKSAPSYWQEVVFGYSIKRLR